MYMYMYSWVFCFKFAENWLFFYFSAFFAASGMAMFHGYDYLEREKLDIDGEDFPAFWDESNDAELMVCKKNIS